MTPNQTYTQHRDHSWIRARVATQMNWIALAGLDEDTKQLITGLAQECFGQGYEAGYERRCQDLRDE